MLWAHFKEQFLHRAPASVVSPLENGTDGLDVAELWARGKMLITAGLAYNDHQTHNGAWACFNQGTRAFKGLLNYESIYRWYIGAAINSMVADKVMYAELRPMLLDKSIPSDDGKRQLGHVDQMQIVCEEIQKKKEELKSQDQLDKFPFGLKIIYSTPRSIPKARMQTELEDCIKLKLAFPDLICGLISLVRRTGRTMSDFMLISWSASPRPVSLSVSRYPSCSTQGRLFSTLVDLTIPTIATSTTLSF